MRSRRRRKRMCRESVIRWVRFRVAVFRDARVLVAF